jgi:hypothetical protein
MDSNNHALLSARGVACTHHDYIEHAVRGRIVVTKQKILSHLIIMTMHTFMHT